MISTREGFEPGWLHCWFVFALPTKPMEMGPLATDLHRVLTEFGTNYVMMTSDGAQAIIDRAQRANVEPMRAGKVGYSDYHLHSSIICKRTEFAYQREFRFILQECDSNETEHRVFDLGDMSDIIHLNPELKVQDEGGTVHLILSKDGLWANPKTFTATLS